jgi:hypothetical protein
LPFQGYTQRDKYIALSELSFISLYYPQFALPGYTVGFKYIAHSELATTYFSPERVISIKQLFLSAKSAIYS